MINIRKDFKTHIVEMVNADRELKAKWDELPKKSREMLRAIDAGERTPNLLNDIMFKSVFSPEINPDWLSKLISAILGQDIRILRPMSTEGIYLSMNSKGVLFDIMVELENGEIAIVEVQRRGVNMPPQRPVVYSANAVVRQHATLRGQKKEEIDYEDIHPVYTIIILEESTDDFKEYPEFHHHFEQKSNTGLDLELIQYYDYICLDVFRKNKPYTTEQLILWLDFLSITDTDEMEVFLTDHSEFVEIYAKACEMLADREELLNMLAEIAAGEDVVASLNKTNESRIRKMKKQLKEQKTQLKEQDIQLKEQDVQLKEQQDRIRELEAQVAAMSGNDFSKR